MQRIAKPHAMDPVAQAARRAVDKDFIPAGDTGQLIVNVEGPDDISITAMKAPAMRRPLARAGGSGAATGSASAAGRCWRIRGRGMRRPDSVANSRATAACAALVGQ